jgi:Fe-S cluster assembly protein SufD
MSPENTLLANLHQRIPRGGPGWLGPLRQRAATALDAAGLPTRKHEAWRFTSLRGVSDRAFARAFADRKPRPDDQALLAWIHERMGQDGTFQVVVVNGQPRLSATGHGQPRLSASGPGQPRLSASGPPAGVQAEILDPGAGSMASAAVAGPEDAPGLDFQTHLGTLARVEHFSALNLALFDQVLALRVAQGESPDRPIHIIYCGVPGEEASAAYPRVLVMAEPGSRVSLVESFVTAPFQVHGSPRDAGAHLTCAVTEIVIGQGARVDHVRAHHGAAGAYVLGTLAVRQERDSGYHSHVVSLGGALCRLDLDVLLADEGAECALDGVYHVGRGEHVDHHTCIDHQAPRCHSAESYRGVLDASGEAVFDGTIVVRRHAQKTRAHQENRNLLLSDDAVINTKPHLRIDADDVSCSHGATIGSLDADQLFYLRSRGIDERRARAMLTYGFVRELLDRIPDQRMARDLAGRMSERIGMPGDSFDDRAENHAEHSAIDEERS